jgi:hypothetical protein
MISSAPLLRLANRVGWMSPAGSTFITSEISRLQTNRDSEGIDKFCPVSVHADVLYRTLPS